MKTSEVQKQYKSLKICPSQITGNVQVQVMNNNLPVTLLERLFNVI